MTKGFDVEFTVGCPEFHQVERCEIARGVVEEHIFTARVRGVDLCGIRACVPVVDGGMELHSRVSANPCRFRHLLHQIARTVFTHWLVILNRLCRPSFILNDAAHELVRHTD